MESKLLFRCFVIVLVVSSISCQHCIEGSGEVKEEQKVVEEFTQVRLNCSADVTLAERLDVGGPAIIIRAQESLLPHITTEVKNGTLLIDLKECVSSSKNIEVIAYVGEIEKLNNDGSGSIIGEFLMRANNLKVYNEGSGSIKLSVHTDDVEIHNDGSGSIQIVGEAGDVSIKNSGSGNVSALELIGKTADVSNDGSGEVTVYADQELSVKLNGSGDVRYGGSPPEYKQDDNGSGSIQTIGK